MNIRRLELTTRSPQETVELGRRLGRRLEPGDVVALIGQLGAGKTQFTRGVAEGVGADPDIVTSPTFVLINEYEGSIPLYHFDAYRLSGPDDMYALGSEEYFAGNGACLVEWADRVEETLPEEYLRVSFEIAGPSERRITFEARGDRSIELIEQSDLIK